MQAKAANLADQLPNAFFFHSGFDIGLPVRLFAGGPVRLRPSKPGRKRTERPGQKSRWLQRAKSGAERRENCALFELDEFAELG
jgi:hypothetical protein